MSTKDTSNPKDSIGLMKDMISLVPPEGIRQTSRAMRYGAFVAKRADGTQGYGPYNWAGIKIRYTVYQDATLRHALKIVEGEEADPDSGLSHWAHISANANIMMDALARGCVIDDRPGKLKK